jgi:deazaflavin-dependent oxidoreductase (nitroreductase family)
MESAMADEDHSRDWIWQHRDSYIRTDGREGHLWDLSAGGFDKYTPTLLLRTVGRKSGEHRIVPLIYLPWGDEYVIIASKGGAPEHPDWYVNLSANPDVAFQIGGKRWHASVRIADGSERQRIWDYMAARFPPYSKYAEAAAGERTIPVVLLKPGEEIATL